LIFSSDYKKNNQGHAAFICTLAKRKLAIS
jgi:hypothetical protein